MSNLIWDVLEDYHTTQVCRHSFFVFENLSSADFCLARVLAKRASKMAASSTGIREHGASEKRKSWRQARSARGG